MTRARRHQAADDVDTTVRREGLHVVHGAPISCCEQGETTCPCSCHDLPTVRQEVMPPAT